MAQAIVEAEEELKSDKDKPPLTLAEIREKAERKEIEGLCNLVSVDIFSTWYAFGGMQRGLSVDEVLSMPAWLRQDFSFIVGVISETREAHEREQKNKTGMKERIAERRKQKQQGEDVHLPDNGEI